METIELSQPYRSVLRGRYYEVVVGTTMDNLLDVITDKLKNSVLLLILLTLVVLLPPYPTWAAGLFLPIKIFSVVIGIVIAVVFYWKSKGPDQRLIITTRVFYIILAVFVASILLYFGILNTVDTINTGVIDILIVLFICINVIFAMLLVIPIIFFPDDLFHKIVRFLRKDDGEEESNQTD